MVGTVALVGRALELDLRLAGHTAESWFTPGASQSIRILTRGPLEAAAMRLHLRFPVPGSPGEFSLRTIDGEAGILEYLRSLR